MNFISIPTLFFALSFSLACASDIQISVGKKNELILSGKSCAQLLQTNEAFCQWSRTVQPDRVFSDDQISCKNDAKGSGRITITQCLPDLAKNYQQKKLVNEGPNCWGTAMSFHQLFSKPRFMWPEELMYWMESPLCRKLKPEENKMPGDIINVFAPEKMDAQERLARDAGTHFWNALYPKRFTAPPEDDGSGYTGFQRLLHSATYISSDLAFGKDSPSRLDRFYFHSLGQTYGRPGSEDSDCQENQNLTPHLREYQNTQKRIKGKKCAYLSLAYRCENIAQHFSTIDLSTEDAQTWQNIKELNLVAEKLFPSLTSVTPILKAQEVLLILVRADVSMKEALDQLKRPGLSKTREMLLTMEYFTAAGLRQTLEQTKLAK